MVFPQSLPGLPACSQAAALVAVTAALHVAVRPHHGPPRPTLLAGDTLNRWLQEWTAVPRVVVPPGTEPPTALSWLRRRGPPLPEGTLHKLFRSKTVRLWDPATQRVSRASKASPLPAGALLLLPKSELAAAAPAAGEAGGTPQRPPSPAQQRQRAEAAAALRGALLHSGPDFLAVCKPAGLATQGGRGVAASVDGVMAEAFRGLPGLGRPQDLRLVHRLDRQTTGGPCRVLMID